MAKRAAALVVAEAKTLDHICNLLLRGSLEFDHPVYICCVDSEKAYDRILRGILWREGVLRKYGVPELLL